MTAVVVYLPPRRSFQACVRFTPAFVGATFCRHCTWRDWLHPVFAACSSCGGQYEVKRDEMGFSMCDEHANRRTP